MKDGHDLVGVLDPANPTEGDHRVEVPPPVVLLFASLVDDAEAGFVACGNRVELVACHRAVEVELSVFVDVVEWHAVRIAVVSQHRENPSRTALENLHALVLTQLLLEATHRSKS